MHNLQLHVNVLEFFFHFLTIFFYTHKYKYAWVTNTDKNYLTLIQYLNF